MAESNIPTLIERVKSLQQNLFVTEVINDNLRLKPEDDNGWIEYKRTLVNCTTMKIEKYATQMRWRMLQNSNKLRATYYVGVDDNGENIGLSDDDIVLSVKNFLEIAASISASVFGVEIITVKEMKVLRMGVTDKKIKDVYMVPFED
jgi:GTPase